MASAEQQAKDSKIDEDALYHGQAAQATPTEGIFQCGKCKSDKVRFALAQVSQRVRARACICGSMCFPSLLSMLVLALRLPVERTAWDRHVLGTSL